MLKINKRIITFLFLISLMPSFSFAFDITQQEAQRVYSTYSASNLPTIQNDIRVWNALHAYNQVLLSEGIVDAGRDEFMDGFVREANGGSLDVIFNDNSLSPISGEVRSAFTSGTLTDSANPTGTAQNTPSTRADDVTDPTSENFQIVPANCYGTKGTTLSVANKDSGDCGWKDLIALLNRIMMFLVYITASLSALAFAYAGFLYMTAFGNSGKIEQAHGIFSKTMIGILFVLLGWLLVATLLKVLGVNDSFSLLNASDVTGL